MVTFAFLGNTLFLTILVSMLSNTFSNISSNATAEIMFRRSVLTLEGVKADAVFAYQPPFNILAVFVLLPLKFVVSPRWFHKIHVASVRTINLPLLLIIAVAERRLLRPAKGAEEPKYGKKAQWFWQRWHLSAHRTIRAVFELPPPDHVHDDIAVDDDLTHHLIRKQFTRQNTNESVFKKPSRRDSMFPGIPQKLQGSITETGELGDLGGRLDKLEDSMSRMEIMLSRLLPSEEAAIDDEEDDEVGESSTLKDGDGFTLESSYKGQD
jgi:acyl-CoA dehydrogenase